MLLYDLEIKKCIPIKDQENDLVYQYCEGWHDYEGMGISTLVTYDYTVDEYHVFGDSNVEEFWKLVKHHDVVIGYCSKTFDDKIVKACWGTEEGSEYSFREHQCVDFGLLVRQAFARSIKLNDLAIANTGQSKLGDGADAPKLWQDRKIFELIDYCLQDVRVLKSVVDRVLRYGYLCDPKDKTNRQIIKRPYPGATSMI